MMATIRSGARLFKAAVKQISETRQKIKEKVSKICTGARSLAQRVGKTISSFFSRFKKKKAKQSKPILIFRQPIQASTIKNKPKKPKPKKTPSKKEVKSKTQKNIGNGRTITSKSLANMQKTSGETSGAASIGADTITNFYKEWEANWGPALNSLDKEFLESASPETVAKVIENARLTLKSPYLKAVYNGIEDLQEVSDLLENDELAKQKVLPLFQDYWERGPEKFSEFLLCAHDKGVFPTRSGERRLSLDPRLIPEWLGLVS